MAGEGGQGVLLASRRGDRWLQAGTWLHEEGLGRLPHNHLEL